MHGPRLMWLVRQGLRHLCFVVIVCCVVVGCTSTSSTSSNAASGGSASPTVTGTDTRSNITASPVTSALTSSEPTGTDTRSNITASPVTGTSAPAETGTDTSSAKLNLASGTGPGGGSNGLSVPVQASAYGSATTVPFMVNDRMLKVSYSYDCSSAGGSGFVADMINGSPNNPGSDDDTIANESATSNSATVTVNPQDTPGNYFLQVNSPCDWTIVVENG
jgi:hypothetical protein